MPYEKFFDLTHYRFRYGFFSGSSESFPLLHYRDCDLPSDVDVQFPHYISR